MDKLWKRPGSHLSDSWRGSSWTVQEPGQEEQRKQGDRERIRRKLEMSSFQDHSLRPHIWKLITLTATKGWETPICQAWTSTVTLEGAACCSFHLLTANCCWCQAPKEMKAAKDKQMKTATRKHLYPLNHLHSSKHVCVMLCLHVCLHITCAWYSLELSRG